MLILAHTRAHDETTDWDGGESLRWATPSASSPFPKGRENVYSGHQWICTMTNEIFFRQETLSSFGNLLKAVRCFGSVQGKSRPGVYCEPLSADTKRARSMAFPVGDKTLMSSVGESKRSYAWKTASLTKSLT